MSFDNFTVIAQKYFPNLQVKYKDQSTLMKILSVFLFFNKNFMTSYITTIGSVVYFPTRTKVLEHPFSSSIVLLHELTHISDSQRYNKFIFGLLYLSPQILFLLFFPLLFISWKIAIIALLFLLPIPSYFRMYFERRAYMVSLYAEHALYIKNNMTNSLSANNILENFKGSAYYYMWIFKDLDRQFAQAIEKINSGQRPYEDPVFDILDKIIQES